MLSEALNEQVQKQLAVLCKTVSIVFQNSLH